MIRTSQLHGRAVVDVDSATKLGKIDELFVDVDRRAIAGISIDRGGTVLGGDEHLILPASAIQSIGEDAVMVRSAGTADGLEVTTRASTLAGRAVVTESGTHLGHLDDIFFDESMGRIVGYVFDERDESRGPGLGGLFGLGRRRAGDDSMVDYVRADADIRFGGDLIVVPDDSVMRNETLHAMRVSENVIVTRTATGS